MKRTLQFLLVIGCLAMGRAQEKPQLDARLEEEGIPLIFSYAPDIKTTEQQEREALEAKIARIDSLDISDTKRYKLIRDLYRNRESKRLAKALKVEDPLDTAPEEQEVAGEEKYKL